MTPRSVVVTGAGCGIGLAITAELAHAGFDVIGTVRGEERAQELREAVERTGASVRTVLLDVTDATSCVRAFTEIATMTDGGPWAVVNNAGIAQPGAIEDVDDEQVRRQLETDLVAPARIARLVLPTMRTRRAGRIVNISAVSGRVSMPLLGWYCAGKQGLEAVTDALRMEAAPSASRSCWWSRARTARTSGSAARAGCRSAATRRTGTSTRPRRSRSSGNCPRRARWHAPS